MNAASQSPTVKELLDALDIGSSVAEHDELLQRYFVETATFRQLLENKKDIIAGDKGTGKTALFRILKERFASYPELNDVEVVAAFNPAGTPVFQRLLETGELDEDQYIGVWKAYFLALAGNWLLTLYDGDYTDELVRLDRLLTDVGLRSQDDTAQTIFSQLINRLKRVLRIKSVEGSASFSLEGMPVLSSKVEFQDGQEPPVDTVTEMIRHDDALALLQSALENSGVKLWLVVDRLDEAFQGKPALERPALRALFRTYLDMQAFSHIRLKLFVRRDLFARIISGGFVNLTHINARRIDIVWDEEDLYTLLYRRITESGRFLELLELAQIDPDNVFNAVFPDQVDQGSRKPQTWKWMMGRVRDANGVKPPRNLIDLTLKSQEAQLRREEREPRPHDPAQSLITGDSMKRGLDALSSERVEDTLLAEAGENAVLIERFRNGKSEHNHESLKAVLGPTYLDDIRVLKEIGFLETVGSTFKIPMLYRSGLKITQGKAFASAVSEDEDEDE